MRCTAQSLACRKSGSYGWCYLRRADVGTELLRVPDRCWSPFFFVTQGGPYICQLPESLSGSCGQRLDEKPFLPGCTAYSTCKIGSMCVCVCVCVCEKHSIYLNTQQATSNIENKDDLTEEISPRIRLLLEITRCNCSSSSPCKLPLLPPRRLFCSAHLHGHQMCWSLRRL